jgi:hypothetical protein
MKCPKCGAVSPEGLNFCKRCWTPVRAADPRPASDPDAGDSADSPEMRGPLFGVPYVTDARDADEGPSWSVSALADAMPARRDPDAFAPGAREADVGPSPRSVLSLILGMLSVVLFCMVFLTVPLDLAGFVLGVLELREINRGAAPRAGRGFATAGVILSGFALVVKLFIFLMIRV